MAVAVLLSTKIAGVSRKGEAATKYFPVAWAADKRTFVVCPGAIKTVSVLKGFTYAASTSTTVSLWPAILKKSSSFSAALISLSMYVFPDSTGNLNPPGNKSN